MRHRGAHEKSRSGGFFLSVPRTGHFSNSFYSNVDELLALRDSLEEEGLIAKLAALPGIAEKAPDATIPYRP